MMHCYAYRLARNWMILNACDEAREFYLKSREEMNNLFKEAPESITNTFAVAEMCDVKLPFGENNYPAFTMPPEIKSDISDNEAYLKHQCIEGMQNRYDAKYLSESARNDESEGKVRN